MMFQSKRQAALGNINLGNLSAPPGFEDMQFLVQQAQKYRGRFVEISWQVSQTGVSFQLTAKIMPNQPVPTWMLYRGVSGSSTLVWGHNSNDLTLMNNLVMLECDKPDDMSNLSNRISDQAMNGMVNRNASSGSMAGAPQDDRLESGNTRPGAGSNPNLNSNPSATWLQNLSANQSAAAPIASEPEPVSTAAGTAVPTLSSIINESNSATSTVPAIDNDNPSTQQSAGQTEDLLDGSLANITVHNLLQYLMQNRASGRLALQGSLGAGEVFVGHGQITHAATLDTKGESALYDLATWTEGQFHFYSDEQSRQQTIVSETPVLVANAGRMFAFQQFLLSAGLKSSSFLNKSKVIPRAEFERLVQSVAGIDVHQQWRAYERIDGNGNLSDLLHACPMVRAEWVPVLANLMQCGWIVIADTPAANRPGMFLEPQALDEVAMQDYLRLATHDDGLMIYGAFLYHLQQEYLRFQRTGSRFALALFSVAQTNLLDGNILPIDAQAMAEACRRILLAKRKLDVIGHFQNEYAMLLPETDSAGAAVFANRLAQLLKKPELSPDLQGRVLVVSFGIASIPDDVRELETILAAVRVAKNKSRMTGAPVTTYGDSN